jgi:hypothetical protein
MVLSVLSPPLAVPSLVSAKDLRLNKGVLRRTREFCTG